MFWVLLVQEVQNCSLFKNCVRNPCFFLISKIVGKILYSEVTSQEVRLSVLYIVIL